MPTYRFEEVKARATRKGKCPSCNKMVTRSRTFMKTVNPFHRNANGTVKTWAEVNAAVTAEAEAWQPPVEWFEHDACRDFENGVGAA
jgi:uncharacterized C2H2 Zn-finger protein